jgi:hypothetical protein
MCWVYSWDDKGKPTHFVLADYFYQACDPEGVKYLEDRICNEVFGVPSGPFFTETIVPSSWYSLNKVDVEQFKNLYPGTPLFTLRVWSPELLLEVPRNKKPDWLLRYQNEQQLTIVQAVIRGIKDAGNCINAQALKNMLNNNTTIKLTPDSWVQTQQWLYDGWTPP